MSKSHGTAGTLYESASENEDSGNSMLIQETDLSDVNAVAAVAVA